MKYKQILLLLAIILLSSCRITSKTVFPEHYEESKTVPDCINE